MKHLTRISVVLALVAVMALVPALGALAQGTNPLCAGLSDADCQLLTSATAAMGTVQSFSVPSWSIDVTYDAGASGTGALSASGSAQFMIPADLTDPTLAGLLVHLVVDEASVTDAGTTQTLSNLEVLLKDNMSYVNYNGEWYGGEITQDDIDSITSSFSGLTGGQAATSGTDLSALGIDLTGVVTTTRGPDGNVGGQAVADFVTTIDITKALTAILSSPMVGQMLGSATGGDTGTQMTPEDLQMMSAMFAPMLTGTTFGFEQWVGTQDAFIYMLKVDAVLNLDATLFDPTVGKISGEFHLAAEVGEHNGSFEVAAPTGYKPIEELNAIMDQMMGTGSSGM
jgi:hypothetical protein